MESMTLTPRLALVASLVPEGARLADVGTDHGKLPISLLLHGQVREAIGSDIGQGPLEHAQRNAADYGVTLSLRLAPGLAAVSPGECDTVSIAGMGGEMIAGILREAPWTGAGAHLLLLQPMTRHHVLRAWLGENGYRIEQELLCREGRKLYTVMSVRGGGAARTLDPADAYLPAPGVPLWREYAQMILKKQTDILRGLEAERQPDQARIEQKRALVAALRERWEDNR